MQHDIVRKKLNYDLLTPSVCVCVCVCVCVGGYGGRGSGGKYHVAAFVILFNLIC